MDGNPPEPQVRIPPHDLDAEAAVLSALFLGAVTDAEPEHFYSEANAWILRAIRATEPDAVLVASWLRDQGRLHQIGGTPYIARVIDATPCVANVAAHAAVVREMWRRRVLIRAFQECETELYGRQLTAGDAWRRMKEACDTGAV